MRTRRRAAELAVNVAALICLIVSQAVVCHSLDSSLSVIEEKSHSSDDFPEQRLATRLLRGYEPWARPCRNTSQPIEVLLQFSLMQINSLDEKSQVLTTTGWLSVRWHDDMLSWDPKEFGNLTTMEIPGNLIWVPIFGLDNHARSLYDPTFRSEFFVRASYDGSMLWDVGNQFVSSCKLELFYYPWDYQACALSFQSYSHGAKKMKLRAGAHEINGEDFTTNGEWDITETRACDELATYDVSSEEGFWTVHFEIHLHRKPKFYITHMITPCVVLSILVFIVFWLPPEAGEKVSLAMTILLSFSVFLLMIAENMPKTGDSVPLLAVYLASFMAASAISIVLSVWIIRSYYHDLNCKSRSTGRLCRWFIRHFAFLIDIDAPTVEAVLAANKRDCLITDAKPSSIRSANSSDIPADVDSNGADQPLMMADNNNGNNSPQLESHHIYGKSGSSAATQKQLASLNKMASDIRTMNRSVSIIRQLYEFHQRRQLVDESCIAEWRLFARVADRFILLLHVVFFLMSVGYGTIIFAQAPRGYGELKCKTESGAPHNETTTFYAVANGF